jgi:hypothetical protein
MALQGAAGGEWNPSGTQAAVNAVRVFWDALGGYLPDELKLTVNPVIDVYDQATGQLTASYVAGTAPAQVTGRATGSYAGGVGFKVVWNTGQIRNGRRVKGSTFVVPGASNAFGLTGTVLPAVVVAVNAAAAQLISGLNAGGTPLAVWSRPRDTPSVRAGYSTEVTQGSTSSKSAIMRGRRD